MKKSLLFLWMSLFALCGMPVTAGAAYWKTVTDGHTSDPSGLGRLQYTEPEDGMCIVLQSGSTPLITGYLTVRDNTGHAVCKLGLTDNGVSEMRSVWVLEYDATGNNSSYIVGGNKINERQFYLRNYVTNEYLCAAAGTYADPSSSNYDLESTGKTSTNNYVNTTSIGVTSDKSKALRWSFVQCGSWPWNCTGPNSGIYNAVATQGGNPEYAYSASYYLGGLALVPIQSDGSVANPGPPRVLSLQAEIGTQIRGPLTPDATDEAESRAIDISWWNGTRTWNVYEVEVISGGANILRALLETYTASGYTVEAYQGGENPGEYSLEAAQAYAAAWKACEDAIAAGDATTEDDAAQLQSDLENARTAVANSQNPLTDGYYYIQSADTTLTPTKGLYVNNSLSDRYSLKVADADANNAAYIFYIKATGNSNSYTVQNYGNGYYIDVPVNGSYNALTLSSPHEQKIVALTATGQFSLANTHVATEYYAAGSDNVELSSAATDYGAAAWKIVKVDDATISSLAESVTQNRQNLTLARLISEAEDQVAATDTVYKVDLDNPYVGNVSQLSTNAPEVTTDPDQSIGNLIDGKIDTYFHTRWSAYAAGEARPTEAHYICAYMPEGTEPGSLSFRFVPSQNSNFPNNYPTKALITASNDSVTWDTLAIVNIPIISKTGTYVSAPIEASKSYNYLKFSVLERPNGASGNGEYTMQYAEFNWYDSEIDEQRSGSMREDTKDALAALKSAIAAAQGVENATAADVEALQTALDNFLAVYPDVSGLLALQSQAQDEIKNATVHDGELGYYSTTAVQTLQQAITDNGGTSDDLSLLTMQEINQRQENLRAALLAFQWGFNKPEAGKIYRIQTAISAGLSAAFKGMYQSFITQSHVEGVWTYQCMPDDNFADKSISYFQFVPASDSTYYIQSEKGGLFMDQIKNQFGNRFNRTQTDSLEFVLAPNGKGGFIISNADRTGSLQCEAAGTAPFGLTTHPYLSSTNGSTFNDWTIIPVNEDDAVGTIDFLHNDIQVVCLPYALRSLPTNANNVPVSIYRVVKAVEDANGTITQLKLALYDENATIAAGEPFIIEIDNSNSFDAASADTVAVSFPIAAGALTLKAGEQNGLVGVLASTYYGGTDGASFQSAVLTSMTGATQVAAQTGYIKVLNVEDLTAQYGEDGLTVDLNGEPIINGIARTTVNDPNALVDVYSTDGLRLRHNVRAATAVQGLPAGAYIVGGRKLLVK